jgi:flagellar assembly protein FliH
MSTSTETILRGPEASDAAVARFSMDLGAVRPTPTELSERVRSAAQAAGYAAGWSEGHQAALRAAQIAVEQQAALARSAERERTAALARALGAVTNAASTLERRTATDVAALEDLVLAAAYQIAEALLGRELASGPETGPDALRRTLRLVPPDGPVTVRLSPTDYATVTGSTDGSGSEQVHDGRSVLLRPDPALRPGDAVADCASTTVDARLVAAVARVREALGAC